jgi:magnesium chelatase family protein
MIGSPGSGKTLLAKALINILPPLSLNEALEITKIYSVAGYLTKKDPLIGFRPFRSPHHSASVASVVGGGTNPKPGEISLAHRGVLFLDEIPEFNRMVIESLRQPLEDGNITIARVEDSLTFPSRFILISAMNPCPCGWLNDDKHECNCSSGNILRYQKKVSGPILDRIDLQININTIDFEKAFQKSDKNENAALKEKVIQARKIQAERFANHHRKILLNSEMNINDIEKYCPMDDEQKSILKTAMEKYGLTMRSLHKTIKIGRTIADIEGSPMIKPEHLIEALQYKTGLSENGVN